MYYYFCSDENLALKVNGIFTATISSAPTLVSLDIDSCPLIEIFPMNRTIFSTIGFIFNDNFLCAPPSSFCVTDLKGGYLIKCEVPISDLPFKVISQHKSSNYLITVFSQRSNFISIESSCDFFTEQLNFEVFSVEFIELSISHVLVKIIGSKTHILIFEISSKITLIIHKTVEEAYFDKSLTLVEKHLDIAKHTVITSYWIEGSILRQANKEIQYSKNFNKDRLIEQIFPYAFLEEMIVGGNYTDFLGDNILENVKKLPNYLGSFIGIFPPPFFRSFNEVGLIYHKSKNLLFSEYFSFTMENRKIVNIQKI